MTPIQYCPPAAAAGSEEAHQFFGRNRHPVSTHAEADGEVVSNGIAFDDYQKMQTTTKARVYRRGGIPEWARSTALTRAVLIQYLEDRAFSKMQRRALPHVTDSTRLARAMDRIRNHWVPKMTATLDRLCSLYVVEKQCGGDPARLRLLECEIEGCDTALRMASENLPAIILSVIYHAYNLGETSVEIGEALHIKPPHARQVLKRLNDTWKRMGEQ
jgi:hypothetical protein